jgi:WD40 repeat protein
MLAGTAQVWDARDGALLYELVTADAVSLAYSPDGELIATGSFDGGLQLWRAEDGELLASFPAHFLPVTGLAFSPDGQLLASGSEDGSILIWELAGQE